MKQTLMDTTNIAIQMAQQEYAKRTLRPSYEELEQSCRLLQEHNQELKSVLRDMLADYKAELRRNHALCNRKGQLDYTKLPIVQRAETYLRL